MLINHFLYITWCSGPLNRLFLNSKDFWFIIDNLSLNVAAPKSASAASKPVLIATKPASPAPQPKPSAPKQTASNLLEAALTAMAKPLFNQQLRQSHLLQNKQHPNY